MANLPHSSRRAALLASVAGLAIAGAPWDAVAQTGVFNNNTLISVQQPGAIALDVAAQTGLATINNQSPGTIIANGANGIAIRILGDVTNLLNSGFVSATGSGGNGVVVGAAGSIGTLTNNAGGIIASTGSVGAAINSAGLIATLSNSGLIQASGSTSVNVGNLGSIGTLERFHPDWKYPSWRK